MNINFRKAILSDYDDIQTLKKQVHKFNYKNRPDFYRNTDSPFDKNEFENILRSQDSEIYFIEFDGKMCGYAFVKIIKFIDNPLINDHDRFFIDDICVEQSLRKRGIGKIIMRELEAECKSKGIKYMDLTVWNFNDKAHDFYRKLGMKEIIFRMEKKID
jgi:diamine N-acetyltransferase